MIARSIDSLGRICIPKEMRRALGIGEGDMVAILHTSEGLLIKPWHEENTISAELKRCLTYLNSYEMPNRDEITKKIQEIEDMLKNS